MTFCLLYFRFLFLFGGGGAKLETSRPDSLLLAIAWLLDLSNWPRGVTVSTLDSEFSDRGSNPREAYYIISDPPCRCYQQLILS